MDQNTTSSSSPLGRLTTVKKHIAPNTNDMSTTDYKFVGWMGLDKDCVKKGSLVKQEYTPKVFTEDDIDIKVTHCGVCGSDIHTLNSGWVPVNYPACAGHEIIGHAVRVGEKHKESIKIGDRVGVGAQVGSCWKPDCEECSNGLENYCSKLIHTYGHWYPDGAKTFGGYGDYVRVSGSYTFKIPDAILSEYAAPMLCAGASVYGPLLTHGCGPGKTVGIIGIGGLGHFGIIFAKALGADKVVAISRASSKKNDALELGADKFIATDEDKNWGRTYGRSLNLILCTADSPNMPLMKYLGLLKVGGTLVLLGLPESKISLTAGILAASRVCLAGSVIASRGEINQMLQLAAEKNIKPWVQTMPMENVNEALQKFERGDPRYRFVLVNKEGN